MTTATAEQPVLEGFDLRSVLRPMGLRRRDLRGLSYEQLEEIAVSFVGVDTQMRFALGDLLVFAEGTFAEKFDQLQAATGLARGTLQNYAWVSAAIALPRRREGLTWSHHEAVARLDPPEQSEWLARAKDQRWSVDELRAAIKADPDVGTGDVEPGSAAETLSDVAHRVWTMSTRDGDAYRVPVEAMLALARKIGVAD